MRPVFLNPQIMISYPPHFKLVGRRALGKYRSILHGEIEANGVAYAVIGQTSCFVLLWLRTLPLAIRRLIAVIEFRLYNINSLGGQVRLVGRDDISRRIYYLDSSHKSAVNDFKLPKGPAQDFPAFFIKPLLHLDGTKAQNLIQIPNIELAVTQIMTMPIFRHFWVVSEAVLPFGVNSRFTNHGTAREEKCCHGNIP